ncbi:CDK5 regulatory subunit-associated protein 3 [Anthonomus grandis grandis]|uniref:CDK5 regulatory subunit-associated protein 3 n=1 Tax=Anthonomus grandis grandis TaxID=2921223 RepID=UPI0021661FD9|nr:CDK5 regulatory subunit-associated protein 3 [Anthonomus grandis grandis]
MDEQNIPIDIHTTKLLDWLISRRHIPKDWQASVLKIRERINNAIQDMPAHEGIIKLVSGQHINYFHCLKIVDILKETEKDSKNIFGRYGSQRMKDWQDIIAYYQKENVYLAEVATVLIRSVSYEIPGLKKQVQKLEQLQLESEKKIKDCSKSEAVSQKEFNTACEQLGIKGNNIKSELLELLKELPKIYEEMSEKIKIVQPAIELYTAFNKYLSGQDIEFEILPALSYLIQNGNTTTYEFKYGEKPLEIEEGCFENRVSTSEDTNNEIDFGDNIDFGEGGGEIDFGDQIVIESPGTVEQVIGQGSSRGSSNEESFEIVNYDDLSQQITTNFEESGIVVEQSGQDGGIARGQEALTILDNPETREQIINDLCELESFLKMRLYEMFHDSDSMFLMSQMQDAPDVLQMQTPESVTTLYDCVNVALSRLTGKRITHLHNIKHSPKYVDLLASSLRQKLSVVERMRATKEVLEKKMKETAEEIRKAEPLIKLMIDRTKTLQQEIQKDLSKKYKGREVNIVGGVNML